MCYLVQFRTGTRSHFTAAGIRRALKDGRLNPSMFCANQTRLKSLFIRRDIRFRRLASFPEFADACKMAYSDEKHETTMPLTLMEPNRPILRGSIITVTFLIIGFCAGIVSSYLLAPPLARMAYSIAEWPVEGFRAGFGRFIISNAVIGTAIGTLLGYVLEKQKR